MSLNGNLVSSLTCKIEQTKRHFAACFWMRFHFYISFLLPHAQTAPLRSTCTYTSTTMMTPPRMQRETTEWSTQSSPGWQKTKLSFSMHREIRKMFLHRHEVPFLVQDGLRLHVFAFSVPLLFLSFLLLFQGPVPGVRAEAVLRHGIPVFRLTVHMCAKIYPRPNHQNCGDRCKDSLILRLRFSRHPSSALQSRPVFRTQVDIVADVDI